MTEGVKRGTHRVKFNLGELLTRTDLHNVERGALQSVIDTVLGPLFAVDSSGESQSAAFGDSLEVVSGGGLALTIRAGVLLQALGVDGSDPFAPEWGRAFLSSDSSAYSVNAGGAADRIDLVACRAVETETDAETRKVMDAAENISDTSINKRYAAGIEIQVVQGTEGAGVPPATPAGWTDLASIEVDAGVGSISDSDITDLRNKARLTSPAGDGLRLNSTTDDPTEYLELVRELDENSDPRWRFLSTLLVTLNNVAALYSATLGRPETVAPRTILTPGAAAMELEISIADTAEASSAAKPVATFKRDDDISGHPWRYVRIHGSGDAAANLEDDGGAFLWLGGSTDAIVASRYDGAAGDSLGRVVEFFNGADFPSGDPVLRILPGGRVTTPKEPDLAVSVPLTGASVQAGGGGTVTWIDGGKVQIAGGGVIDLPFEHRHDSTGVVLELASVEVSGKATVATGGVDAVLRQHDGIGGAYSDADSDGPQSWADTSAHTRTLTVDGFSATARKVVYLHIDVPGTDTFECYGIVANYTRRALT